MAILQRSVLAFLCFLSTSALNQLSAGLNIDLELTGFTASQEAVFVSAKNFWESKLIGYKNFPTSPLPGNGHIQISGMALAIDGVGNVLGSAGPTTAWGATNGFLYTASGEMVFDVADIPNLSTIAFQNVILHEMAHVLGFGTLWDPLTDYDIDGFQDVYDESTFEFTGANAVATYNSEFNQSVSGISIEQGGGPGTAGSHWNEVDGGAGSTGIVNAAGVDFKFELMTGWLNSPAFVSNTTIASFADIGYVVSVPEPTSMLLAACVVGYGGIGFLRRKLRKESPC